MRGLLGLTALMLIGGIAYAELQEVSVGGELRIRGRWYINVFQDGGRQVRIPNASLRDRAIGFNGASSLFGWNHKGEDWSRAESTMLLNVKADFTENVSAFIEFYDHWVWGEDFRSQNYVTGADTRNAAGNHALAVEQAYIEMREIGGLPLRLRIGRQDLKFGKGFLISNMLTPSQYVSHDGIRLTYEDNGLTVDAIATRIVPVGTGVGDDVDLFGVYGTYSGWKPLSISAYYFLLRDPRALNDTKSSPVMEWVEGVAGRDDYGATLLNTVGARLFGDYAGFDYDAELAYQFGPADRVGFSFKPVGKVYGDDHADFNNFATDIMLGYTFKDVKMKPRLFVRGVCFEGHDNRDISFTEWLNPFYRGHASVSFNRMFSDTNYMPVLNDNGSMSNFAQFSAGVEFKPWEPFSVHVHYAHDWVVAPFDPPRNPVFSFMTRKGSNNLADEIAMILRYEYSKDLSFMLYTNYTFTDKALTDGSFSQYNGTDFTGGSGHDNAFYIFWMAVLKI
jgi:hypothetical protein